jgi:putative membrane protein
MLFNKKHLLLTSVLALGALHCGGSSTPTSNTPESASDSSMAGDGTEPTGTTVPGEHTLGPATGASTSASQAGTTNAANTSDAAPENSGAHSALNLNDRQIAKVTDSVHSAEIEQARLAQKKTTNEQVRHFASMMIEQHTQARQQQLALNLSTEDSPLSERLTTQSQATLDTLQSKQGAEFDQAYLQAQVAAHQQVLDAIKNELRPNAQNPQLQVYLQQLEPKVAEHLEHARQAQRALQSSTTNSRGSSTARTN